MPTSFSQTATLTCPHCGRSFDAQVWLIVDGTERPDLLARARAGTLHDIPCPHCGHTGQVDAPLLLYRPQDEPRLIFSPAQGTTAEQDREQAGALLGLLREGLGPAWRDEWVEEIATVPRPFLSAILSDDPEAAAEEMAATMAAAPAIVQFVGGTPQRALEFTQRMYEITLAENNAYQIPVLGFRGTPTGIDVLKVVDTGIVPAINTGIAHKEPGIGMVGAGLVTPPISCFRDGARALAEKIARRM
jgi:rRNA maturation protein Nop10